jgi:hypothetical protein
VAEGGWEVSEQIKYRGYVIVHEPPSIPSRAFDWQFWHEDYNGPEDHRCGLAASLEEAKRDIDEMEDD